MPLLQRRWLVGGVALAASAGFMAIAPSAPAAIDASTILVPSSPGHVSTSWQGNAPFNNGNSGLVWGQAGVDDIDLFECNEAFASVVLAWMQEIGVPHDKVNVNGGGIALGHPIGATGTRLMTTLLNELERTGGRYGLQTMCEGGGQANVTIIERL